MHNYNSDLTVTALVNSPLRIIGKFSSLPCSIEPGVNLARSMRAVNGAENTNLGHVFDHPLPKPNWSSRCQCRWACLARLQERGVCSARGGEARTPGGSPGGGGGRIWNNIRNGDNRQRPPSSRLPVEKFSRTKDRRHFRTPRYSPASRE